MAARARSKRSIIPATARPRTTRSRASRPGTPPTGSTGKGGGVHLGHLALLFLAFSILCLATTLFFSTSLTQQSFSISHNGVFGPIEVKEDQAVHEVTISARDLLNNSWAFVEAQLLDANREYLFSFGDELSLYSGRDSDGPWVESKYNYSTRLTIPKAGTYHLRFLIEQRQGSRGHGQFAATVRQLRGSTLPFFVAGIAALLIAIALNEIQNRTVTKVVRFVHNMAEDD